MLLSPFVLELLPELEGRHVRLHFQRFLYVLKNALFADIVQVIKQFHKLKQKLIVMNNEEKRQELIQYLQQADERFLNMVYAMSQEYIKQDVTGYRPDGTPLTEEDIRQRAKAASQRVKNGQYISHEEVEKEMALQDHI